MLISFSEATIGSSNFQIVLEIQPLGEIQRLKYINDHLNCLRIIA